MSLTILLLLAALAVAVVAISWWVRSRAAAQRPEAEAERFQTTMGALRDLREALGPSERAARGGPDARR